MKETFKGQRANSIVDVSPMKTVRRLGTITTVGFDWLRVHADWSGIENFSHLASQHLRGKRLLKKRHSLLQETVL